MHSVTITGNVEKCRTEAEISDSEGAVLAVVYETSDGWHTDIPVERPRQAATDFLHAHCRTVIFHHEPKRKCAPSCIFRRVFPTWIHIVR